MRSIKRDIVLTLVLKGILLFGLWSFCVKSFEKPKNTQAEWLLQTSFKVKS